MSQLQEIIDITDIIKKNSDLLISKIGNIAYNCSDSLSGSNNFLNSFTIFILACFVGYFVVWKVTPALHTPLMAVTNAISGVIIVGAIISLGITETLSTASIISFIAIIIASINIFGGFFITKKMLEMFKK
jgi:NAD(P) transhydrogenase subunit alpha